MKKKKPISRRDFIGHVGRGVGLLALGGVAGGLGARNVRGGMVWQIDPSKCVQCGQCQTHCVLDQSAVRCFHDFSMCGYCDLCTGFLEAQPHGVNEGAENQLCPTGAIKRKFVTDPYFEYEIDEDRCIACGLCVKGCTTYGNGSLYLQVRQDLCKNCNECAIARDCPSNAFVRVPASDPYITRMPKMKTEEKS